MGAEGDPTLRGKMTAVAALFRADACPTVRCAHRRARTVSLRTLLFAGCDAASAGARGSAGGGRPARVVVQTSVLPHEIWKPDAAMGHALCPASC